LLCTWSWQPAAVHWLSATLNPLELSSQFVHRAPDLGYDLTPKTNTHEHNPFALFSCIWCLWATHKNQKKTPKNRQETIHQTNKRKVYFWQATLYFKWRSQLTHPLRIWLKWEVFAPRTPIVTPNARGQIYRQSLFNHFTLS